MTSYSVKGNHICSAVSENLRYKQTDIHPVTLLYDCYIIPFFLMFSFALMDIVILIYIKVLESTNGKNVKIAER